ncbi:MAG: hypothetical protein CMJ18_14905, partial [Phycisphaeraceae bacterium]|nr:hypothetical protein [Phycisphaeraceae bacterium]
MAFEWLEKRRLLSTVDAIVPADPEPDPGRTSLEVSGDSFDPPPPGTPPSGFSVDDVVMDEGGVGASTNLVFSVTRADSAGTASVQYATASSSAASGSDFTAHALTTLNFADGEATKLVTVVVSGDAAVEADETFTVDLSNPVGTGIDDGQGVGTIRNDDTASLTVAPVSASEGDAGSTDFVFDVTLDAAVQGGLQVAIDTSDGTATVADSDYVANTGSTLTFAGSAGETQSFTVPVSGDTTSEADELFNVALGALSNLGAGIDSADITTVDGTGTIQNDDGATLSFNDASAPENDGEIVFIVTLAGTSDAFTVDFATADIAGQAVAGTDYTATSGSGGTALSFSGTHGETATVTVTLS